MIYGFLNDEALHVRSSTISAFTAIDSGVGYLSDRMVNYFNTPNIMRDTRTERLQVLANQCLGEVNVNFDGDQLDGASFSGVSGEEFDKLFNIMEYLYLCQDTSKADMNTHLTSSSSDFGVYVNESIDVSDSVTIVSVRSITGESVPMLKYVTG